MRFISSAPEISWVNVLTRIVLPPYPPLSRNLPFPPLLDEVPILFFFKEGREAVFTIFYNRRCGLKNIKCANFFLLDQPFPPSFFFLPQHRKKQPPLPSLFSPQPLRKRPLSVLVFICTPDLPSSFFLSPSFGKTDEDRRTHPVSPSFQIEKEERSSCHGGPPFPLPSFSEIGVIGVCFPSGFEAKRAIPAVPPLSLPGKKYR